MLIKEYRVIVPVTVEEYQIAQLYAMAEASKHETGGGEGIEVLKNEPFENYPLLGGQFSSGQYTHKIYHLSRKIPSFIRFLAPKNALEIHEKAWNAYPYCRTVVSNPCYMKDNFSIVIESYHLADAGDTENVHDLPLEKLKLREVVTIDIGNDPVEGKDYKKEEDPSLYKSRKTGRGPLTRDWRKEVKPIMTCYKLVTAEFKWFGLQTRIESFIHKSEGHLFRVFHRKLFCWMDEWYGLTMADIRAIEERTKEELDEQRNSGEVRGMRCDNVHGSDDIV